MGLVRGEWDTAMRQQGKAVGRGGLSLGEASGPHQPRGCERPGARVSFPREGVESDRWRTRAEPNPGGTGGGRRSQRSRHEAAEESKENGRKCFPMRWLRAVPEPSGRTRLPAEAERGP